jgi:hypothetical protein
MRDPTRTWMAYLVALFYFTSLALGGLFFTAIHHVTKAGWSVNIRRLTESFSVFLPMAALAAAGFLIGAPKLYVWLDKSAVATDELLTHKASYLNGTFFVIRLAIYFLGWIWFSRRMVGASVAQDTNGDVGILEKQLKRGIAFILFFAISYSLFAVDLVMSIQPHWFSTIFGVYCFAGMFQMTMATTILLILHLKKHGALPMVTEDHLHDLGKFLFAMTVFWAYIAFSQYMLIWYANLPEETVFIIARTQGKWLPISLLLLIGKFIVPFIALLPRWAKRTPAHLAAISIWILIMQFVDLYWLIYPAVYDEAPKFGLYEICIFAGFLGVFLFTVSRFLSRNNLIPIKDPRIAESMHHHVTY